MNAAKISTLDSDFSQKYQLLARIGAGGMGDVFLGIQRGAVDFSRLVVIKRIHDRDVPEEHTEENAKMFLNEASVIASLNHPHIVKIFDFCMDGSAFSIVMEYVEGETLKYIFSGCEKQNLQLPVGLTCSIIYDACNALHYAHNSTSHTGELRRIIHRDIGLHNLMLDSNGYLKIIDFGIAKSSIQTDMTSPGLVKGNPLYMAPEVFNQASQDHRLDIYALGLCLYELLTHSRAFRFSRTATLGEVIEEITHRELTPPSRLVPDLPEGMDDVVLKAVAKNREERYQTAEELGQDIKRVSNHVFMTGSERQKWFLKHFATRLNERREFGAKILELANNTDEITENSLPSRIPGGFQIASSITPSGTKRTGPRTSLETSTKGFFSAHRYKIAVGILLVVIVAAVNLVFFGFQETTSKTVPEKVTDNLAISCRPPGARLFIDGKERGMIGSESLTLRVTPNENHELVISKDGYRDFTVPFVGPSTETKRIRAVLVKTETVTTDKEKVEPPSSDVPTVEESSTPEKASSDHVVKGGKAPSGSKTGHERGSHKGRTPDETSKTRKIPLPDDDEVKRIPVMLD